MFRKGFCLILFTCLSLLGNAQEVQFKKDSLVIKPFEYYSNVLAYKLPTGTYKLRLSAPAGFSLGNQLDSVIRVRTLETKYQVLRFKIDQSLKANDFTDICLELESSRRNYLACFQILAEEYHKVNAAILKPSLEVYEGERSVASAIRVVNEGNVPELINLSADAAYPLRSQPLQSFKLLPGEDTIINYPVSITGEIEKDLPAVRFIIASEDKTFLQTQRYIYLRSAYQQEAFRNRIIPLNANFQFQSINGNLPVLTIGLTGNTALTETHSLGYRYFGVQHIGFTKTPQFLNGWLSWDAPYHSLMVGRLQYQGLISMNAPAAKLNVNVNQFNIESMFIQDMITESKQVYTKITEQNDKERRTLSYTFLHNKPIRSRSNLLEYDYSLQYNENLRIGIRPAAAITYNFLGGRITGQLGGNLFYQKEDVRISANGLITSIAHPTYNRGENSLFLEALKGGSSKAYGLSIQHTFIKAKVVSLEGFRTLPKIFRGQYDLFRRSNKNQTSIQYNIGFEFQEYRALRTLYPRPRIIYMQQLSNNSRLIGNFDIGPSIFIDSGHVAYRHALNIQYFLGNFQARLRYNEGPQDYYEQVLFLNDIPRTGISQIRLQQNFYLGENWGRVGLFTEYTHQHVAGFKRYSVGANLSFRIFKEGRLSIQDQIGFGGAFPIHLLNVQCSFFVPAPIPFTKLHPDLSVMLIKDVNGNRAFDGDDLPIVAEYVAIDYNWLITDEYGVVKGEKLKEGIHQIDLSKVQLKGWVPAGDLTQEVLVNGDTKHIIFFNRSKVLEGKIEVIRDKRSKWNFDLEFIRVEAISESGKIYTALTDAEGRFSFNLPEGNYRVRYNSKIFSSKYFKVMNPEVEVSLVNNDKSTVIFEIRENQRRINFRN